MAVAHLLYDQASQYGNQLRDLLNTMERGDDLFADIRDVIIQMVDGGSGGTGTAANYGEVVKRFGVGGYTPTQGDPTASQLDIAKAIFTQIDSVNANMAGGPTNARNQLYSVLR